MQSGEVEILQTYLPYSLSTAARKFSGEDADGMSQGTGAELSSYSAISGHTSRYLMDTPVLGPCKRKGEHKETRPE